MSQTVETRSEPRTRPRILPDDEHNRELVRNAHPADWVNPTPKGRYNLVVIGSGTAGLTAAAGCATIGGRVALIERHLTGKSVRHFWWVVCGVLSVACWVPQVAANPIDHRTWDGLLHKYVDGTGLVDYAGVAQERQELDGYLAQLAMVSLITVTDVTLTPRNEQLAFWINAYNACVFKGVLDHSPLKSVKDVQGFFDGIRYPVGGESLTLNEIEERGRALGDWRIHFAVACASSSCPPLRSEAYVAEQMDDQLSEQTARFLADRFKGLRVEGNTLWVSKIFKWYTKDFVPSGKLTAQTLVPLLIPSLEPALAQAVQQPKLMLKFLEYDWSLNDADCRGST